MSAGTVEVIAVEDCFFNGIHRKRDDKFTVARGQETMSASFRPVTVGSVPQGEVEDVVLPRHIPPQADPVDPFAQPKREGEQLKVESESVTQAQVERGPQQPRVESVSQPDPKPVVQPVFELHRPDKVEPAVRPVLHMPKVEPVAQSKSKLFVPKGKRGSQDESDLG